MLVVRLAFRALAWRAGVSLTVFAVALVGVLAAAVGPIYLHAVDQAVLAERLQAAPQSSRDIHIVRRTLTSSPETSWVSSVRDMAGLASDPRWFAPAVHSEEASVTLRTSIEYATHLASIDDLCAHVHVAAGRCLTTDDANVTLISSRTARTQHISLGDTLQPQPVEGLDRLPVHVVGIVDPIDVHGTFWSPWSYFNAHATNSDTALPQLDSLFVSQGWLEGHLNDVAQTVSADIRLRVDSVKVEDITAIKQHIDDVVAAAAGTTGGSTVVGSQLPDLFDAMNHEMSLARTLILLPTAQLVLLAMFILYAVVARTTDVLGPEVALAKLRGRRSSSVLLQGIVQPIVLILLATPLAALLAWLVVRVVADHLLDRHVDVVFPLSAVAVIGAAAGAAVIAAVAAARRIVVSPVGALLRRGTDASGSSLGVALSDVAVAALALAGLAQLIFAGLLESGKSSPVSALAPVLLGVAIAIVVVRLLPFAGQLMISWTRDSRRLASFLAVRQIVRRPAATRVVLPVGIALTLATFALVNWSVAAANRSARALNRAGASTVLRVQPAADLVSLRAAVDRADPSGNSMAAAVVQVGRTTPLLAVDTARFAKVAAWRDNYSAAPLSRLLATLHGAAPPAITITGDALRLSVHVDRSPRRDLLLSVSVTTTQHLATRFQVPLTASSGRFDIALGNRCDRPCRITGLGIEPAGAAPLLPGLHRPGEIVAEIAAQVRHDGAWQIVGDFDKASRWRSDATGLVRFGGTPAGLKILLGQTSVGASWPELVGRDVPARLPAALASGTAELYPGPAAHDVSTYGLDDEPQEVDGLFEAATLPELDRYGVLVDYDAALRAMGGAPGSQTRFEVWLSPSAPADIRARLARQQVRVIGAVHASTFRKQLDHTGPALAGELDLIAAVTAVLLAIGAALLAGVTTARRRGYEVAALEAAGVPGRVLRRSLTVEQALLLAIGVLVGVGAGLVGSVLALPSTPFFVNEDVGPPSDHALPWGTVGILVGTLVAVFALTCVAVSWLVARQATPARFREAQQ